jgi:hypothetical protein
VAGNGLAMYLLQSHHGTDGQSLIKEKNGSGSPTFAPVAATLVYPHQLLAFLLRQAQSLGLTGHGEAFGAIQLY